MTTDLEPPARVTGLALAVDSRSQITATWTAAARADQYLVEWATTSAGLGSGSNSTVSTNRAVLTSLTLSTTYYVRVTSIRAGASNGSPSLPESASTSAITLLAPANVAATPSTTTVGLAWDHVIDATGYVVEWKTTTGAYNTQSPGRPSIRSYTITGLQEGTTYIVRVKATASGAADSGWSTPISTTTTISPLPQVTGLSVSATSISSIDASWTLVAAAESYVVQWRVTGGTYILKNQVEVLTNSAPITGLASGTGYQVRVAAQRSRINNGAWSGNEGATTLSIGQVGGVQTDADHEEIVVTWTPVSGAARYAVQWSTTQGSYSQTNEATVTAATYTITDLSEFVDYYVRVRSAPPLGIPGAWSTEVMVTTDLEPPARVTGLALAVNSRSQITATWTAAARADRYLVEWATTSAGLGSGSDSTVSTNRAVLTSLTLGTTYHVRVTSVRFAASDGSPSVEEFATTLGASIPGLPRNLLVAPALLSLVVSWDAPLDDGGATVSGYSLQYRAPPVTAWTTVTATGTSHTLTSLLNNQTYEIRMAATNSEGTGSYTSPVSQIPDGNSPPVFSSGTVTRTVPENSAAGVLVGAPVTATDPDTEDVLTYSMGGANATSFSINGATGQISVGASVVLNFEAKPSYSVTVTATDDGTSNLSDSVSVTIELTDVNEPPVFPASASRSVDENLVVGSNVGQPVVAVDPEGDTVAYAVIGTNLAGFVATSVGRIQTGQVLDHEATSSYTITLQATAAGGVDTIPVTISVVDVNEAPVFASASVARRVTENSPAATAVGSPVAATDPEGDTLAYTVAGTNAASFDIESTSGQLSVASGVMLDHETKASYSVTVVASDGSLSSTVAVSIQILDVAYEGPTIPPPTLGEPNLPNRTLTETLCSVGDVPGCPHYFLFVVPMLALGFAFAIGARHPALLFGVALLSLGGTSFAINPNMLMIGMIVMGAVAVALGVTSMVRR